LHSPVHWTETIRDLIRRGSSSIIECGPGKVLTGLTKRIDRNIPAMCIDTREAMTTALAEHAAPCQPSMPAEPNCTKKTCV
jgi:[acyl-carrier-protein] S-malonyltransferase